MRVRLAGVVLFALCAASPALADDTTPNGLAGLLLRFFSPSNPLILKDNPVPAFSHAAHFASQPNAQETLRELNRGIAFQLSTFPVGSSSAAFTYTFDPELGVYNRNTETFGPIFAERPLTAGKGKFSMGVNYQKATYDTFEGRDLQGNQGNDIALFLTHLDTNKDNSDLSPWFEGDVIRADLNLKLTNETAVFYANYGLAERLDVGVAIPYTRVDLDARIDTTIERLATGADPFVVHQFNDGSSTHEFVESGHAEGLGDMVVRAKYNFLRKNDSSLAALMDLRLPTGNADDLLGSGATQLKLGMVWAYPGKRFAPRAGVGYTFSSGGADFIGDLPNEFNYSAGFDAALHRRVSLTGDFLGRYISSTDRLVVESRNFQYTQRTDPTVRTFTASTPVARTGSMNLMLGSAGIKINPVGRLLLVGSVLVSVGSDGLQDKVTPVFGMDYSF